MEYHYQVWVEHLDKQIRCVYQGTNYEDALLCLNTRRDWGYVAQLDRWTFKGGTERLSTDLAKWERF